MSFEVMLAKTYDPRRIEIWNGITVEPKLDGVRVLAFVRGTADVRFYSRNGRQLKMFDHLNGQLGELVNRLSRDKTMRDGVVFDGEMVDSTFGEISGAIHRKNATVDSARYHLFHVMPLARFDRQIDVESQEQRMAQLESAHRSSMSQLTVSEPTHALTHEAVMHLHEKFKKKGFEGSMVKDLSCPWQAVRSYAWMKIKDELSVDVRVTGMKEGAGKYVGMCGALMVDYKGKRVMVSGMTDEQRVQFWQKPRSIVGRVVEVKYQLETVHGSLRHPRFLRLRPDKE